MNEITIIGSKVLEQGLWKFYLAEIILLIIFIHHLFRKKETFFDNIVTWSIGLLVFIIFIFILLAHITQIIL